MTVQTPIPDFAAARAAMVDNQLRPQGVTDPACLAAMGAVAREHFVPEQSRPLAYFDRPLTIGDGRFHDAAGRARAAADAADAGPGERALVVGAGTGYSAAVLRAHRPRGRSRSKVGPTRRCAPASWASTSSRARSKPAGARAAPYDLILIDGAVEIIPDAIVDQLADGGRLGAAMIDRGVTRLVVGRKAGGAFGYLRIADAGVPALPGFNRPRAFTF